MGRLWFIPLVIILILALLAGYYFLSAPQIKSFSPADGTTSNPGNSVIRLVFSRQMNPESVSSRFQISPTLPGSITWQGDTMIFTPDQPWEPGQTIWVEFEGGARPASNLSAPLGDGVSWSFSIRRPLVVYQYPSAGISNLYVIDPATLEKQQLTAETGGILGYDIDREGNAVYYSTSRENGGSAIYRLNLSGSTLNSDSQGKGIVNAGSPHLILECLHASCRAPRISPGGNLLAYEQTAAAGSEGAKFPQVWIYNLGGGSTGAPQLAGEEGHQTLLPHWSPDGVLAFYDKDLAAFIFFNPATGETLSFPNQTGEQGSWHPGGNYYTAPEISFVSGASDVESGLETLAVSQLIRFDMTDKSSLNLSPDGYVEDTYPAYSPDGTALVFSRKYLDDSSWTPGRQIWILPEDNSQAVQYTFNPNIHYYDFSWSPDSHRLAYARVDQTRLTDPPEIWILDPQTGTSEELVKGGFSPRWIP